ncbi:metallophosphoesterase family protein [Membranihabitans maritimus]|uniref:metallophosphoesterase family protein n=1 Tax=Membranihabitans maritimus TaxID=2904244 RepID=UPI001F20FA32|nr:metallophosphoesterase [Membranihabitans maritimus]
MKYLNSKITFTITITFLLLSLFPSFGKIVYPWRAVPAFAEQNKGFVILFNNTTYSDIDSVILSGPFNRVLLKIDSISTGRFTYDLFTKEDVNNKIWVRVPESTPEELYDLKVFSHGEVSISRKSVKVLKEFKSPHFFIHISDTHVSRQWEGTGEAGYAKELELLDKFIEVANIINPDFTIVTGDIIHHYSRLDADSLGWGGNKLYEADQRPLVEEKYRNYFEGSKGFSGVQALNGPVFSLPGNHDSYGVSRKDHLAMARQWNALCGKRVYGFSYGQTRVLAADDYLGDPVVDIPDASPMSGLQGKILDSFLIENGPGTVRIMAQHRPDRIDTSFLDKRKINILLNGHRHNPHHEYVGSTPTLSIRPGTVCRSGEIERWKENLGFFRIFYINGDQFEFTSPLRFCEDPTAPHEELKLNLTLDFKQDNNGTNSRNEATIENHFSVDLPRCKVRFVMGKANYHIDGGVIQQIIHTDDKTIVDVLTDVQSKSIKRINIYPEQ